MYKLYDHFEIFEELCKASKKWGVYVSFDSYQMISFDDYAQACPYLKDKWQVLSDGMGIFLCDTEEEMNHIYQSTVGDDGPTMLNSYNGPARIYALTCGPNGQPLTENT